MTYEEFDFSYYEELERYCNKQCHICGGWALECDCDNEFSKEDKEGIKKLNEYKSETI